MRRRKLTTSRLLTVLERLNLGKVAPPLPSPDPISNRTYVCHPRAQLWGLLTWLCPGCGMVNVFKIGPTSNWKDHCKNVECQMGWRFGVTFFPLTNGKEQRQPSDLTLPSTYPFAKGSLKPSLADSSPQPESDSPPPPPFSSDPMPPASLSQTGVAKGGRVHRQVGEITHHPLSAKMEMVDELRAAESLLDLDTDPH